MKASEARQLSEKFNNESLDSYLNLIYDRISNVIKKGDGYRTADIESLLPYSWVLRTRVIEHLKTIDGYEVSSYSCQKDGSYTNVSW